MTVGKAGRPIHDDARAKIRPRIFLEGNFFVDLEPGTPGAPEIEDDGTIPINQTAVPVQFDQLLTSLQSDTREDLKTLLDEYGNALDKGGAEAFNRSIPYWKSAYRDTAIVNEASLGETEHDLSGYVKNAGATAAALDRNPEQLKSLITDFNTTAAAFAREQGNLRAVDRRAAAHAARRPAGARLAQRVLPAAARVHRRPAARACAPPRPRSTPRSRSCASCAASSPRTSCAASPPTCARRSRRSPAWRARASRWPSRTASWRAARTRSSCRGRKDKVEDKQFPAEGPVYTEAPKAFPGLAGESRSGDANGQWFRVLAAGGTNLVQLAPDTFGTTTNPILGANPPKPKARPPLDEKQPCENQETPDLRSQPADPPQQWKADTSSQAFQDRYDARQGPRRRLAQGPAQGREARRQAQGHRRGRHARA